MNEKCTQCARNASKNKQFCSTECEDTYKNRWPSYGNYC